MRLFEDHFGALGFLGKQAKNELLAIKKYIQSILSRPLTGADAVDQYTVFVVKIGAHVLFGTQLAKLIHRDQAPLELLQLIFDLIKALIYRHQLLLLAYVFYPCLFFHILLEFGDLLFQRPQINRHTVAVFAHSIGHHVAHTFKVLGGVPEPVGEEKAVHQVDLLAAV